MSQYKLIYFNLRARGEIIRLIFAAAGQKYEDHRIERNQWPAYKPQSPFGQLPLLEIRDGNNVVHLCQSIAIARHLSRKFGLAGKNELETTEIDMYGDQVTDLQNHIISIFTESDNERKKQLQKKVYREVVPFNLKLFDDRLGRTGSGYFAPSGLSWADLHVFNVLEYFRHRKDETIASFKNVKALDQRLRADPKIAAWLAKRPKTDI